MHQGGALSRLHRTVPSLFRREGYLVAPDDTGKLNWSALAIACHAKHKHLFIAFCSLLCV